MKVKLGIFAALIGVFTIIGVLNTNTQIKSQATQKQNEQISEANQSSTSKTSTANEAGNKPSFDISKLLNDVSSGNLSEEDLQSQAASIIENLDVSKVIENKDIIANFCPQYKEKNLLSFVKSPDDLKQQFGDKAKDYYELLLSVDKACQDDTVSIQESLDLLGKTKKLDIDLSKFGL